MADRTADPVFPNAGVEVWYRGELQSLVQAMWEGMLRLVREAWDNDPDAIARDARPLSLSRTLKRSLGKWSTRWQDRIEKASDEIATDFAKRNRKATETAMRATLAKAGFTVRFRPSEAVRAAYDAVIAENVGLIRTIPQKFLADVQTTVWQAVMQGSDLGTLVDQIQEKYGIAWRRAALIATDQNAKAKAAMERARRLSLGISRAVWMHSHAGKEPRPSHVKMDGKPYQIAKGMWDSAEGKLIWPGTEIHCRCTDRAVIPGFE